MIPENELALSVIIGWDFDGFIELDVKKSYKDFPNHWVVPYLGNSVPVLLNQELCELDYLNSLRLCGKLIPFLNDGILQSYPIPPVLKAACVEFQDINEIHITLKPNLKKHKRDDAYNHAVVQFIVNYIGTCYGENSELYKNRIKENIVITLHNYLTTILPSYVEGGETSPIHEMKILSEKFAFDHRLTRRLKDGFNLTPSQYNKMLNDVCLAYEGYKNHNKRPQSLMSKIEKYDFALDHFLPALEQAAIRDLHGNEKQRGKPNKKILDGNIDSLPKYVDDPNRIASLEKTHNYMFAHVAFPIICLGNPRRTYSKLNSSSSNNYIVELWKAVGEKVREKKPPSDLGLSKTIFIDNGKLFVVKVPRPKLVTEVVFIGIHFAVTKSTFSKNIGRVRYFTLELSANTRTFRADYYLCEWIGAVNPKHKNYGPLENHKIEDFISAIKKRVQASNS